MRYSSVLAVVSSLSTCAWAGTASVVAVLGANGVKSTGFGIEAGRFPHDKATHGDAGADAGIFETVAQPDPVCGKTWRGVVDVAAGVKAVEKQGVPSAYANGSVVAVMLQIISPGGGPARCEFDPTATGNSFKPMTMDLNMLGNFGIRPQVRVNSTIVATFPNKTTCRGGAGKNLCLVRCRCGQKFNGGGCFVVKLSSPTFISKFLRLPSVNPSNKLAARSIAMIKRSTDSIVKTLQKRDAAESGQAIDL